MSYSDPLTFLSDAELGVVLAVVAGWTLYVARWFPDLKSETVPCGIFCLQLAFKRERVRAIVKRWTAAGCMPAARRSLLLDLVFIVLYTIALVALTVLAARAAGAGGLLATAQAENLAAVGAGLAMAAGVLDVLENIGLALELSGRHRQPIPLATSLLSAAKWLLLASLVLGALGLLIAGAISGLS